MKKNCKKVYLITVFNLVLLTGKSILVCAITNVEHG